MAQKIKEAKDERTQEQKAIIKSLRTSAKKYENVCNTNLSAIEIGRKIGLYKELKSIIGRY